MVCHWFSLRALLSRVLISATDSISVYIFIAEYHQGHDIEICAGPIFLTYDNNLWAPCFAFEAILALLAVWASIKYSKQQCSSKSARFNKSRLVDSLVRGNVIYFIW